MTKLPISGIKKEDITIDLQILIRGCYEQVYINRLENVDQMHKLFQKHKHIYKQT